MFSKTVIHKPSMPLRQRTMLRAWTANRERKGIFQADPDIPISIQEARDAYNCCRMPHDPLNYTNPSYTIFSVDGEMVEKYIDIVEELEWMYVKTKLETDPAKKITIGPFTIYITRR